MKTDTMKTSTEFIQRYDLLPQGSHVLCALSGGRDSVYLLYQLLDWAKEWQLTVSAAHYNHHLRGAESDRDEGFVRELCRQLQVKLYVDGSDVGSYARANGMGVEEAARTLRYEFLEQVRAACGADVIATAHHADDLAETMLFQLARGSGAKGLSGIPPKRGNIVRPILMTTRQEIDAFLTENRIAYMDDSTNAMDDGSRNVIRHQVIPVLQQINPAFVSHAARSSMLLREDDSYLQTQADLFLRQNPQEAGIEGKKLLELEYPIASRVVRSVWGNGLQAEHVHRILELCGRKELAYVHVPGCVVRYDRGRLWTDSEEHLPNELLLTEPCGDAIFGAIRIHWETRIYTNEIHNSFTTFCLKYENISGGLSVTSRKDGDRVKLAGNAHTKKLKHLFQERQYTQPMRAAIPVFRDDAGIVAVCGFGIAQRCVPEIGDKIIYIQCDK